MTEAKVTLPALFTDNMILQQNQMSFSMAIHPPKRSDNNNRME